MPDPRSEHRGFTFRAAAVAASLSLFLLMSSTYIALKLGALPWPIIFSVVASGGLLKVLAHRKPTNIHEINVAQAGASIGGLISAGIAFTVPGILFLQREQGLDIPWPDPWLLAVLTVVAGLLGILLSVPLKRTFIDIEELPYPAGTAGAELLKVGKTGGKQLFLVICVGAGAALFALVRDVSFPAGFAFSWLAGYGIFVTLLPMPLAVGGGFILGPRAGFSWLAGALIGWLALVPLLFLNGSDETAARTLTQNLGMGIVLGSGVGFFAVYVIPRLKAIFLPVFQSQRSFGLASALLAVASFLALSLMGVPWLAAILTVVGAWITVAIAARMTGETNIDPLEQFGIFVGLVVALCYGLLNLELSLQASFIIVTFVSVTCAIAGDAGHDFKSAHLLGTRFFDVVKADIVAVLVAGLAAPFVLQIIRTGFAEQLFTPAMPAPQAQMVASSISGFAYPKVFLAGFGGAFLLEVLSHFLPKKAQGKLLLMPLGIGLFLGLGLAIPLALGALIRSYVDKKHSAKYQAGVVIAAGLMGGEGIAGFGAGAMTIFGMAFATGALYLGAGFLLVLAVGMWKYRRFV